MKKPPDGFFIHLLFASETVQIFGGLFLHRISGILKVKLKWLRVPTTYFARLKFRTRKENPNPSKPSWKIRKNPPKGHTKNRCFVFFTISKGRIFNIISSRVEFSEQVGFDSDGSSVIVDKSENQRKICSLIR